MYFQPLILLLSLGFSWALDLSPNEHSSSACTLFASGGDDAPKFVKAVKSCDTITIPKTTTLNIATRMNMTGVNNKHIVCHSTMPFDVCVDHLPQDLQGTIRFEPDIPYWTGVCHKISHFSMWC